MILIVDYDKLSDVSKEINTEEEKLQKSFDNIENILKELENCWKGKDYLTFIESAKECIINEKEKAKKINILGDVIDRVADNYREKDLEWLNKLKEKELEK